MKKTLKDSITLDVKDSLPPTKKSRIGRSLIPRVNQPPLEESNNIINKSHEKTSSLERSEKSYSSKKGIFLDIQGVIKEGTFPEDDQIFCKYDIVYDKDWEVVTGQNSGQSQHACLGEGTNGYFVWNMPFQIRLYSDNPENWPQLVISCFCPDFLGREMLKAYGTCYIPTMDGTHERNLSMFCPISSYGFTKIYEIIYGEKAELINAPKIMALGDGREILRTQTEGRIKIKFNIHLENLGENGYEIK
jgi:hypothetical protein